ncbi:MAG: helix-turn-helix transcriptional regulator [Nocardioidaceae bacterium]|nr:helix-turn-helix transcriptional regulator [Nocardioidaceae bacterium]
MQHTGAVIRAARKAQNLSLRQLADLCEVDYTTLSRIENGKVDASARTIKAITEALGKYMAGAA